jgi:hypothetical protein
MAFQEPAFLPRIVSPRAFLWMSTWTITMVASIGRQLLLELRTVLWFQSFWENR